MNIISIVLLVVAVALGLALLAAVMAGRRERGRAASAEARLGERERELSQASAAIARLEERAKLLGETSVTVAETFKAMSADAVNHASAALLKQAEEAFVARDRVTQERIAAQLKPVTETLGKFAEHVQAVEKARAEESGGLKAQITALLTAQSATTEETRKLAGALRRGAGIQGRWGEQMLRNVLEMSGLRPGVDFHEQVHAEGDDGARRPDVVVNLPGGGVFVIDSKVSLTDYVASLEAQEEPARELALKAHADSVRRHFGQLSSKAYWTQFDRPPHCRSPDIVVMFVPSESAFACVVERHPALVADAWEKKVAIVTPMAMFPLLRAVAYGWRAEDQAANAREIAEAGRELHKRVSVIAKYAADLGGALDKAVRHYNEFTGSLDRNVLTQARRMEGLAAASDKVVVDPPMLDVQTRPLVKLTRRGPDDEANSDSTAAA